MLSKEDIDLFLTGTTNHPDYNTSRYEYFCKLSKKYNGQQAEEAVSSLIEYLYFHKFEFLTEALCVKVLKNYSFYNNPQRAYDLRHTEQYDTQVPETETRFFELMDTQTFYSYELHIEGKLSPEAISKLEKLRSASSRLPPWAKKLYDMHFIESLTIRQISSLVGIPPTSVFLKIRNMKELLFHEINQAPKLW